MLVKKGKLFFITHTQKRNKNVKKRVTFFLQRVKTQQKNVSHKNKKGMESHLFKSTTVSFFLSKHTNEKNVSLQTKKNETTRKKYEISVYKREIFSSFFGYFKLHFK